MEYMPISWGSARGVNVDVECLVTEEGVLPAVAAPEAPVLNYSEILVNNTILIKYSQC